MKKPTALRTRHVIGSALMGLADRDRSARVAAAKSYQFSLVGQCLTGPPKFFLIPAKNMCTAPP